MLVPIYLCEHSSIYLSAQACQAGDLKMVRLLVQLGASPTHTRDTGATPFYITCEQGHLDVVGYLHTLGKSHSVQRKGMVACGSHGWLDIRKTSRSACVMQAWMPRLQWLMAPTPSIYVAKMATQK
eukprot:COSAG01_NODE_456_length_16789_cov_58.288556_7_plen_126_part_00